MKELLRQEPLLIGSCFSLLRHVPSTRKDKYFCPPCISKSGGTLRTTRTTDIGYIGRHPTSPGGSASLGFSPVSRKASVPREPSLPLSPVESPIPSLPFSHSPHEVSPPPPPARERVPVLRLTVSQPDPVRLASAPSQRLPTPPFASTSHQSPLSPLPVSSRKRKSGTISKGLRLVSDSSPEPNTARRNHPIPRSWNDLGESSSRGDQHVLKKRKATINGSSRRDDHEPKVSRRRNSGKDSEFYDSMPHPEDGKRTKEKIKRPLMEYDRDTRADIRYDDYLDSATKAASRSVPRKPKRKEKDVDDHSSAEHGRRYVRADRRDTTVSSNDNSNKVFRLTSEIYRAMKILHRENESRWSHLKRQQQLSSSVDLYQQNLDPQQDPRLPLPRCRPC